MYSEPHDLLTAVLSGVPIHAVQYSMGSRFRQKIFFRQRDLLPQELQQSFLRNANLPSNADASYLTAADQFIVTFHGLRHTYAAEKYTSLVNGGMTPLDAHFTVSRLLGHERPDVTDIYLASVKGGAARGE